MHDDKEDWMIKWTDEEKAGGLWSVAEMRDSNGKRFSNVPMPLNFSKLGLVEIIILANTVHEFTGIATIFHETSGFLQAVEDHEKDMKFDGARHLQPCVI